MSRPPGRPLRGTGTPREKAVSGGEPPPVPSSLKPRRRPPEQPESWGCSFSPPFLAAPTASLAGFLTAAQLPMSETPTADGRESSGGRGGFSSAGSRPLVVEEAESRSHAGVATKPVTWR